MFSVSKSKSKDRKKDKKSKKDKKKTKPPVKARKVPVNEFVELETGMLVGEVYISSVKQDRKRFRKMSELQVSALRDSVGRLGPRDAIIVVPGKKKGTWDLIDGNHRLDELRTKGYQTVPVVLLTDKSGQVVSETDAKLAMHSFNVTADIDEEGFFEVLGDMQHDGLTVEQIATATARDRDAIEELLGLAGAAKSNIDLMNLSSLMSAENEAGEGVNFSSIGAFGEALTDRESVKESSRGTPIVISLPGTEDMEEMLDELVEDFDADTRAEAVVELIKQYSSKGRTELGEDE